MNIYSDLRFSLRIFRKTIGSTGLVVSILALGVGVNTAVFTLVNGVLWKQLPFREPDRLTTVWSHRTDRDKAPLSLADYEDFQAQRGSLADIAVFSPWGANLLGDGDPERLNGIRTTSNVFELLGVSAAQGRVLQSADDAPNSSKVAVIADGLWKRRFGGDRSVVGRTIILNGESYVIVGILSPSFFFPVRDAEVDVPLSPSTDPRRKDRGDHFLTGLARLKPGASGVRAEQELTDVARRLQREYPATNAKNSGVRVTPLAEEIIGDFRKGLLVLLCATGLLLLMACFSMAGMLLARASARGRELAIRISLGATRWDIVRQLLVESLLLSLLGGGAALLVGTWSVRLILAFGPADLPGLSARLSTIRIDSVAIAVNMGLAVLAGLLCALVPALLPLRGDPQAELRAGHGGASERQGGNRARKVLVIAELAVSLTLLIVAGLLLRSFARLQNVQPGFDPGHMLVMRLSLPPQDFPGAEAVSVFARQLSARVKALPGVEEAGGTSLLPMSGVLSRTDFTIVGKPPLSEQDTPSANYRFVSPGLLASMRVALQHGRDFSDLDTADSQKVAIVSETLVRRFFPSGHALGEHIKTGSSEDREIVGVASDVKQLGLDAAAAPDIYVLYSQGSPGFLNAIRSAFFWTVRTTGDPLAMQTEVRRAIRDSGKSVAFSNARSMDQYLAASVAARRFNMLLLLVFAAAALLVAGLGVYGVISYSVGRRTREFGLRLALGARSLDVLRLVVGEGLLLTASGCGAGLAGGYVASRMVASLLFEIAPADLTTYLGAPILLISAGLLASYVPARYATTVDPLTALRCD